MSEVVQKEKFTMTRHRQSKTIDRMSNVFR